jgi:glutathione S-transferase
MTTSQIRIWSFEYSPFAGKVRAAFHEKGIEYEIAEINPGNRPARLRELNPFNRVPVVEVGDEVLLESPLICDWIEENYPEPALWPADSTQRAQAKFDAYWFEEFIIRTLFGGMRKIAFGADEGEPEDIGKQTVAKLANYWPKLEERLAAHGGEWLAGDMFTYGDLGAMPAAVRIPMWAPAIGVPEAVPDAATTPLVDAYFERLRQRPSASAIEAKGDVVHSGDSD